MAGKFVLLAPLFDKFDAVTKTYVTDISSNMITTATPVIMAGLTLGFLVYALAVIRGAVDAPINELIWRCLRIGIIVSVATAGGLYQTQIADAIITTPDALASAIVNKGDESSSSARILDDTAEAGFDVAAKAFENAGIFEDNGIIYAFFGVVVILATATLLAIGGAFIIMAKVGLAILAGFGPLFIFLLLWRSVSRYFELWVAQVVNYSLLIVLVSVVFTLLMSIYSGFMSDIKFDKLQNAAYNLGGAVIISIAAIILLLQLPSIASGLAGGVGLSYMWEMRMLRSGIGSVGKRDKDGKVRGSSGVLGAVGGTARMTAAGARLGASGVKRIAGYARGKIAG